jgi:hypothetical protein
MIDTYNNEPDYFDKLEAQVKDERTEIEVLEDYIKDTFDDDELTALIDSIKMRAILMYKTNKRINEIELELSMFGNIYPDNKIELASKKLLLTKLINDL